MIIWRALVFPHLGEIEPGIPMRRDARSTASRDSASLGVAVGVILRKSAEEQMIGARTQGVVATVTDDHLAWDLSVPR